MYRAQPSSRIPHPAPLDRLALAVALLVGLLLYAVFRGHGFDDSYITYRYADNLARGLGFVYNPGERVLSTTAPLYALLLVPAAALGLDLAPVSNLLACLGFGLGGLAIYQLGRIWAAPLAGAAGGLLYSAFPLLVATIGGETGVYQAVVLWGFVAVAAGRPGRAALLLGLATLIRADGVLAAACAGLAVLAGHWRELPAGARGLRGLIRGLPWAAALIYLVIVGLGLLWAWAYFGAPFPVTLEVKRRQGALVGARGFGASLLSYLGALWALPLYRPTLLLAGVGLGAALWRRAWLLPIGWGLLHAAAYALLAVTGYFWYFIPGLSALLIAAGLGLETLRRLLCARLGPVPAGLIAGLLLAVGLAGELASLAYSQPRPDQRLGVYRAAAAWLRANAGPDERVGALEVGVIGYYARRPMIDFAGLVQPEVSAHYGRDSGYASAARYAVARYRPALLVLQESTLDLSSVAPGGASRCARAAAFPHPGFPTPLTIYRCRW